MERNPIEALTDNSSDALPVDRVVRLTDPQDTTLRVLKPGTIARKEKKKSRHSQQILDGIATQTAGKPKKPLSLDDRARQWGSNPNRRLDFEYVLKETLKSTVSPQIGLIALVWGGDENILAHRDWTIAKITSVLVDRGAVQVGTRRCWTCWRVISKSHALLLLRACRPSKHLDLLLKELECW
jgi:hypothetical protein